MGWGADTIGSHNPGRQASDYRIGLHSTCILVVLYFKLWRYNLDHYFTSAKSVYAKIWTISPSKVCTSCTGLDAAHCMVLFLRQGLFGVYTTKTQYRNFEKSIPRKGIARPQSHFPHLCVCERFKYSHDGSAYSAAGKYVDRTWKYINRSHPHECGHGSEATQFVFWEYINGLFVSQLGNSQICYYIKKIMSLY